MALDAAREPWDTDLPAESEHVSLLMARYQQGDPAAVEELVRRLSPRLYRFVSAPHLNQQEREDLLQECWLRLHRARHTYRPTEPALPWIFAVARHTKLDAFRRRRRRMELEVLMERPPDSQSILSSGSNGRSAFEVEELLNGLPDGQREVLVMLKVSGMSVEEVARVLSTTAGAVKQKAHRAYQRLRGLMEGRKR